MESAIAVLPSQSQSVTLDNDVLLEIFSYLDLNSWLTARQVCRNWNDLAFSLKRIPLVLKMDRELLGSSISHFHRLDSRLFRYVLLSNERLSFNNVFTIMSAKGQLNLLKELQITIFSQGELNVFATVLNLAGIPNLQKFDIDCKFEIKQHPFLRGERFDELKSLRIRGHSKQCISTAHFFYKSLIESAVNLTELTIEDQYDIRESTNLRRLFFKDIPLERDGELFRMNWNLVGYIRLNLTTLSIRNCLLLKKLPVFPNVTNLELVEFQGEIPNMTEAFPKLRKLTAGHSYYNLEDENNTVRDYLERRPALLEVLQLTHVGSAWTEDILMTLQKVAKDLPNFKLLKFVSRDTAMDECPVIDYAFSIDVPHLFFDVVGDDEGWVPQVLYRINEIEKPIPVRNPKRGLVTFCNSAQEKEEDSWNDEDDYEHWTELVQDFPKIISKILGCWERVEFRNVVIREWLLNSILADIEKHKFNIGVFHGTSISDEDALQHRQESDTDIFTE